MQYNTVKLRFHGRVTEKHNTVKSGESGISYAVLPAPVSLNQARDWWRMKGWDPSPYRCSHEHDCCGCGFQYGLTVRQVGNRALLTQLWGTNI